MLVKPTLALSCCSLVCLCGCTSRVIQHHETMVVDGELTACGHIFLARSDASATHALLVDLNLEDAPLAVDTAREIPVTSMNSGGRPVVQMEDWSHRNYYCNCSPSTDEPDRWRAIAGRLTITRMADPTRPEFSVFKAHGSGLVFVNAHGDIREVDEWEVPHFGINLKAQ